MVMTNKMTKSKNRKREKNTIVIAIINLLCIIYCYNFDLIFIICKKKNEKKKSENNNYLLCIYGYHNLY